MAQPTHRYLLKWSKCVTPKVMHLCLVREDEAEVPFVAGQFITLHIESPSDKSKILHRSYSIANIPGKNNEVEIACSFVEGGVASQLLFNLKPGEALQVSGPYGIFTLKEEAPTRYLLIATGTGVTPYRAMLDELQKRLLQNPSLETKIILGVRTQKELLFAEEFIRFSEKHANFKFFACYSRESESLNLQHFERRGHVQDLFPELNLNPGQDVVYLCGNPDMIDSAFTALTGLGFDRKSVRREKYLFAH